jgi:hypothetical protein
VSAKYKRPPPDVLNSEDVRWLEIVRRTVDGLAAMAEAMAEGCDTEWIAMQSSLETLRDTVDSILKDYKERIKETGDADHT